MQGGTSNTVMRPVEHRLRREGLDACEEANAPILLRHVQPDGRWDQSAAWLSSKHDGGPHQAIELEPQPS